MDKKYIDAEHFKSRVMESAFELNDPAMYDVSKAICEMVDCEPAANVTAKTYAVFWKFPPSAYEPDPEWKQFDAWHMSLDIAKAELEMVKQNPRCAAAKIVVRTVIYDDYGGTPDGN